MKTIDFSKIDLLKEPPVREPERQYYFIAKAREYVREQAEKAGHPLKHRSGRREDDLFFSFSYFCAARIKPKLR